IRTRREKGERLITRVEVLSPINKTPGEPGRELYLSKQRECLGNDVNLVEIDLLRAGDYTTAVPLHLAKTETGPFDYHVCVHRYDRRDEFYVYAIHIEQPLPTIAIPLLPGNPSVTVDLQAAFTRAYEAGPYRRRVHYGRSRIVP